MQDLPIFYSFRRCPYAMRARLALVSAGVQVELREIVLRDKPAAFLAVSPSATVPALVHATGTLDESLDIMRWALAQADPEGWLEMPEAGAAWIARCDGPFKHALDRTKYATRYPNEDTSHHRAEAALFLSDLNAQIDTAIFARPSLADAAILPFVRQFAFIDKPWFDAQPWPNLHQWLQGFLGSDPFQTIMPKFPQWQEGDAPTTFPNTAP